MVACQRNTWQHKEFQECRSMSPSAQLTSEQLTEIIEDEKKTKNGAREVQKQVEDGAEVLNPENNSSVMHTVPNAINHKFEHKRLDWAARLLNTRPIQQSQTDQVPGNKCSVLGLSGTNFPVHQVCAILFIVSWWIWHSDMPEPLVADAMELGKPLSSVTAAMICKLPTEKGVKGLLLSIEWGNTLEEWVNMAQNDYNMIMDKEREWYPLQRRNSVPGRLLEIQTTPAVGYSVLTWAH